MMIIAIDPGTTQSALVAIDPESFAVIENATLPNDVILNSVIAHSSDESNQLAIEMVASYGMAVGAETFETVLWIGRFIQAWGREATKVYRKQSGDCDSVAMHLCKNNRAADTNIKRAILDMYPATGGGATPQVGTKKQPGPLYCLFGRGHEFQALAVAITFAQTFKGKSVEAG